MLLSAGQAASDVFTYTMADSQGAAATATLTIALTGTNRPPVAQPIFASVSEDGPSVDLLAAWSDPENNVNGFAPNYLPGTIGTIIKTATFTTTYSPNGQFEYLAAGETASDQFTFEVFDTNGAGSSAIATVTIIGQNDAPIAVADTNAGDAVVESGSTPATRRCFWVTRRRRATC